ncbi:MAG TPA: hypothetical protein VFN30_00705 [Chitinophagaceae bacterium]|nr:hypothetical protein [Chitinophagaceae bacterium]
MDKKLNKSSRRKLIQWGAGLFAGLAMFRFLFPLKKSKQTVKLLTHEGKLVEVDVERIKKTGKKVTNNEIHDWVKNKPTL